jgi:hypothetical protein
MIKMQYCTRTRKENREVEEGKRKGREARICPLFLIRESHGIGIGRTATIEKLVEIVNVDIDV